MRANRQSKEDALKKRLNHKRANVLRELEMQGASDQQKREEVCCCSYFYCYFIVLKAIESFA